MAQYEEITIDQGADVALEIHLQDKSGDKKNLTNHTVTAKAKKTYNSTESADIYDFTTAIAAPATDGVVTISLTNTQTDTMKAPSKYVYDVEMSYQDSDDNTIIERVLEGILNVSPSVTK
jgi:hypothetical protein